MGKPLIITISGPSGTGKSSLINMLLKSNIELAMPISVTTRSRRQNEVAGKDYHFKTLKEFKEVISSKGFLEYQEVYDNQFYGTLKSEVMEISRNGKVPLIDIDVNGALSLKTTEFKLIKVFIYASYATVKKRLILRNTESLRSITKRLNRYEHEISLKGQFDYIINNEDCIKNTFSKLNELVTSVLLYH